MITWKITLSCINNNIVFVLINLLLRPFYISYNTWIIIQTLVMLCFLCSWIFARHLIVLTTRFCYQSKYLWWIRRITLDLFRTIPNREQYICINNVDSNTRGIQCGVPQGSILGALLFLISIIITKCSNQFKNILYTDDSTLSTYQVKVCHCQLTNLPGVPGDNVMDSDELINSELKCLDRWLKLNKISINADKTKYYRFQK